MSILWSQQIYQLLKNVAVEQKDVLVNEIVDGRITNVDLHFKKHDVVVHYVVEDDKRISVLFTLDGISRGTWRQLGFNKAQRNHGIWYLAKYVHQLKCSTEQGDAICV